MRVQLLLLTYLILVLNACNPAKEKPVSQDSMVVDSIRVVDSIFQATKRIDAKILSKFVALELPELVVDSTFIKNVKSTNALSYIEVRELIGANTGADHNDFDMVLNSFYSIDSIKLAGTYERFTEQLDIGQMKDVTVVAVGYWHVLTTDIYLWKMSFTTYEACPFWAGDMIMGTFVNSEGVSHVFQLAESSGGGDPPSMGSNYFYSKINREGKVTQQLIDSSEDLDAAEREIQKVDLAYQINADATLSQLNKKSWPLQKEKIEQQEGE